MSISHSSAQWAFAKTGAHNAIRSARVRHEIGDPASGAITWDTTVLAKPTSAVRHMRGRIKGKIQERKASQ